MQIFEIHNLSIFLGNDLKNAFFTSGLPSKNGTHEMPYMYDILNEPICWWHLRFEPLFSYISFHVCHLFTFVDCFLTLTCHSVCLLNKIQNKSSASVLNSYNFTILRCILLEKRLCLKPKYIHFFTFIRSLCCFSFLSSTRGPFCCFVPLFFSSQGARGHAVVMVNDPFSAREDKGDREGIPHTRPIP